jgi:hypothetical protein
MINCPLDGEKSFVFYVYERFMLLALSPFSSTKERKQTNGRIAEKQNIAVSPWVGGS